MSLNRSVESFWARGVKHATTVVREGSGNHPAAAFEVRAEEIHLGQQTARDLLEP